MCVAGLYIYRQGQSDDCTFIMAAAIILKTPHYLIISKKVSRWWFSAGCCGPFIVIDRQKKLLSQVKTQRCKENIACRIKPKNRCDGKVSLLMVYTAVLPPPPPTPHPCTLYSKITTLQYCKVPYVMGDKRVL